MSLPNIDREMLLSGALDGTLSGPEQTEFDRLVTTDLSFAEEFRQWQQIQRELVAGLAPARAQRMSLASTNRIVAAAFENAQAVQNPVSPIASTTRRRRSGWIAAAVALAASVMAIASLWNREPARPLGIADSFAIVDGNENAPHESAIPLERVADAAPVQPLDIIDLPSPESLAESASVTDKPTVMGIKPSPADAPIKPAEPMIAATDIIPPVDASDRQPLSVLLVLAVELSQSGRELGALQEALRVADIRLGKESVVSASVASELRAAVAVEAATGPADSATRLLFIEASAKRLDRLMIHMMSKPDDFVSVGLSLVTQPPLLVAASELREIDPTKVRQEVPFGTARDLVFADGRSLFVDNDNFIPLDQESVESGLVSATSAPPAGGEAESTAAADDFPSQLLLLVK